MGIKPTTFYCLIRPRGFNSNVIRLIGLSGNVMRLIRLNTKHWKEIKAAQSLQESIVLKVILNLRSVNYLGCLCHCNSHCGDKDTLKTVASIKAAKRRQMAMSPVNSKPIYIFLIWLSVLYT